MQNSSGRFLVMEGRHQASLLQIEVLGCPAGMHLLAVKTRGELDRGSQLTPAIRSLNRIRL